jgi:DNA-binding CsgD family transcriptional regulator
LDVARADSIPTNAQVHLTRRERDVLLALARGRTTNRELAAEFVITEGTANLHVKHILSKLGLSRRAQIATWVYSERGELDRPAPEASSRPARQDLAHPANQPGITRANRTPGSKNSSSSCSK